MSCKPWQINSDKISIKIKWIFKPFTKKKIWFFISISSDSILYPVQMNTISKHNTQKKKKPKGLKSSNSLVFQLKKKLTLNCLYMNNILKWQTNRFMEKLHLFINECKRTRVEIPSVLWKSVLTGCFLSFTDAYRKIRLPTTGYSAPP